MAGPLDKTDTTKKALDGYKFMPQKPMLDMSLESNLHPKEAAKKVQQLDPFDLTAKSAIENDAKTIQKTCKNIIDHICGCRYHPEDIIIGEASIDTQHFQKPDPIILQQQALKLGESMEHLARYANLGPPETIHPMEAKYKAPIIEALKDDLLKTNMPYGRIKTAVFGDQTFTLETTQTLLDDTVDLVRNAQNVLVQLDKLKTADTINWELEEARAEQKRQEEIAKRAHEEEVKPLKSEKAVIDQVDGLIKGFAQLPDQLHKTEKLTDPSLQELPKFIKKTKDGYPPDPLVSEDDLILCVHPVGIVGVLGLMGVRAIARKANTIKEANPDRPTPEKITAGLQELSAQVRFLKEQTERFNQTPSGRNPEATWSTMQQFDALRNNLPKVKDNLDELEDLPNKFGTWNLAQIRAAMLRAESNPAMQEVLQAVSSLKNERADLEIQINPPVQPQRRGNPYYGYPGSGFTY